MRNTLSCKAKMGLGRDVVHNIIARVRLPKGLCNDGFNIAFFLILIFLIKFFFLLMCCRRKRASVGTKAQIKEWVKKHKAFFCVVEAKRGNE